MNSKFYRLSKIVPLNVVKYLTGQHTIYPFYHAVSDRSLPHIKHLYPIRSSKQFVKDLDFLLKYYTPIDINFLIDSLKKKRSLKNNFLLSFDDGLTDFYDVAAPILIKKGIPAVCFLNTGFIDNQDLFFRYKASILIDELIKLGADSELELPIQKWFEEKRLKIDSNYKSLLSINYNEKTLLDELANLIGVNFNEYLKERKPYMSTEQVSELIRKGFSFGAHSIDHPQYSDIDINNQLNQTKESIKQVSSLFEPDYKIFSFPFTDFNVSQEFFDSIFDKGNEIADITFGCAGLKKDSCKKNIQRIPIEIDMFSAKEIIKGEYLYFIVKAMLNRNVIRRN